MKRIHIPVLTAAVLVASLLGLSAPAQATTSLPSPTIETLPARMRASAVHQPRVTAVPRTKVTLKYSNLRRVSTGRYLTRWRDLTPGQYRVDTSVSYNVYGAPVQHSYTETNVISPAVPDRTVTETWSDPQRCEVLAFTPQKWAAQKITDQHRLDMSGPPPGVWRGALALTGLAYGPATYSCPASTDQQVVVADVPSFTSITWTPSALDDYRFVFNKSDTPIQTTADDFDALRHSVYWGSGGYSGCDNDWWTPCPAQPLATVRYSYSDALGAPAHTDRLDQIESWLSALPTPPRRMQLSRYITGSYVVAGHPAVTTSVTNTWWETPLLAKDRIKHRTQWFRVVR